MSVEINRQWECFPTLFIQTICVYEKHIPIKANTFDALIERRRCTAITPPKVIKRDDGIPWEEYHDDDEDPQLIPDVEDIVDATGKLIRQ